MTASASAIAPNSLHADTANGPTYIAVAASCVDAQTAGIPAAIGRAAKGLSTQTAAKCISIRTLAAECLSAVRDAIHG